jgi:hypothetical protein
MLGAIMLAKDVAASLKPLDGVGKLKQCCAIISIQPHPVGELAEHRLERGRFF